MASPRYKVDGTDWQKLLIGLGIALGGAAIAWVATELIPFLKDKGEATDNALLLTLAAFLSFAVNFVRKWYKDNVGTLPNGAGLVAFALLLALPATAMAEPIIVVTSTGRHYLLTEGPAGALQVTEVKQVVSTSPNDNPNPPFPPPGPVEGFAVEVRNEISKTGDPETAMMMSAIYSLAADEVAAGELEGKEATRFLKLATDKLFEKQAGQENFDLGKWNTFRSWLNDQIARKEQQGELTTNDAWVKCYRDVSAGAKAYADGSALRDRLNMGRILEFVRELIEIMKIVKELLDTFSAVDQLPALSPINPQLVPNLRRLAA